jgi:drug/metabolite transporter (DMT)-like permease
VIVEGIGRSDAIGLLWALTVFVCEAGFTLLAVPVLGRHGPEGVSVHTTWLAAAIFGVLGVSTEGWWAAGDFERDDVLALGYLAVGVTAIAFILWYSCVRSLGAGRAGLLTGIAPIAAAVIGIPVTGDAPATAVWTGIVLIAVGLAMGLGADKPGVTRPRLHDGSAGAPSSDFRIHSSSTIAPSPHGSGRSETTGTPGLRTPAIDPA